ncbi:erythromycin esterase family protein [Streptomyces sp. NPDC020141]|uniref:erythromycin esterase family protein n=1 Tax=Streptomyces sp. NPDC020141 TaxID=3365065 RepID=UPI0037B99B29
MPLRTALHSSGLPFTHTGSGLGRALDEFLDSRDVPPLLLGLGEPTHGIEAFPRFRNQVLRHLVEHRGCRSIAVESDCLAALAVDEHITGGGGRLEDVLATGFSHDFGALAANRELVGWLRGHNEGRAPRDQVRFHGVDAPIEMSGTESPRTALTALHRFLADHLDASALPCPRETIDSLLGDDAAWNDPATLMDPARSVGGSDRARRLRAIIDDLLGVLAAESPGLAAAASPERLARARLFGRTARGLLRYHAIMADTAAAPGARIARMMGARDAMLAENLLAVVEAERDRGPSLVFAHNHRLRRDSSALRFAGMDVTWWSAGTHAASDLAERYAVIACDLGAAPARGIGEPAPDTLQGLLHEVTEERALFPAGPLAAAADRAPGLVPRTGPLAHQGYLALDSVDLGGVDAVAFFADADAEPDALPGGRRESGQTWPNASRHS